MHGQRDPHLVPRFPGSWTCRHGARIGTRESSYRLDGERQIVVPGRGDRALARGGLVPVPVFSRGDKACPILRYLRDDARAALACAADNARRLGLQRQIKRVSADLFPPGPPAGFGPVVCNPPWVPAPAGSALESAVYHPGSRMLQVPADGAGGHPINGGGTWRHELLADAQLTAEAGRPVLSISRAQARVLPMALTGMERHALGSQSFLPLGAARRLVLVVARPGPAPQGLADLAAFVSDGAQGVWLAPGTWHHALLALDAGDFLVVERRSDLVDCDEVPLQPPVWLAAPG